MFPAAVGGPVPPVHLGLLSLLSVLTLAGPAGEAQGHLPLSFSPLWGSYSSPHILSVVTCLILLLIICQCVGMCI